MKYTFSPNFYEKDEEQFNLKESFKWNKMVFKKNIIIFKNRYLPIKYSKRRIFQDIFGLFKLGFITKIILLKLKFKNKKNIYLEYSPLSNSRYIYYGDGVKIRISDHLQSDYDNSDIYILV